MTHLRFQKRIRLFPGLTLNLSKSGVSLTLGVPGFCINIGRGDPMSTVGLPGTGLSWRTRHRREGIDDGTE